MRSAEIFWEQLVKAGVIDPEGIHHELVGGRHGPKADFDVLSNDKDEPTYPVYEDWVDLNEQKLWETLTGVYLGRVMIIGVANGTNRLVTSVEQSMGRGVTALHTEKNDQNVVVLTKESKETIRGKRPSTAFLLEDVGKSGKTTEPPLLELRQFCIPRTGVIHTLQRRDRVERLDAIGAEHTAIIKHLMPDYPGDDCLLCQQGSLLIPKTKK